MLSKKKNKVYVLKISKIFSLQAIDQMSYFIFLDDNNNISKVDMEKMGCYLDV